MQVKKDKMKEIQLPMYNPQNEELKKSYLRKGLKGFLFCNN
jgi:hypothetical protein